MFGKVFNLYFNAFSNAVTIGDEVSTPEIQASNSCLSLNTRTFVAGGLAFFSLILGKENRSSKWCNWCMLSPKEWAVDGHEPGEKWSIQKIYDVRNAVKNNNLTEIPQNIKGCTEEPLFGLCK